MNQVGRPSDELILGIQFTSNKQAIRFVSGFLQGGSTVKADLHLRANTEFELLLALPGRKRSATTTAFVRTAIGNQKTIVLARSAQETKRQLFSFMSLAENTHDLPDAGDVRDAAILISEDDFLEYERVAERTPPPARPEPVASESTEDMEETDPKTEFDDDLANIYSSVPAEETAESVVVETADVDACITFETVAYLAKFLAELRGGNTAVTADSNMPVGQEFDVELQGLPNDDRLTIRVAACEGEAGAYQLLLGAMAASSLDDLWQVMTAACKHPDVLIPIEPGRLPAVQWLGAVAEPEPVVTALDTTGEPAPLAVEGDAVELALDGAGAEAVETPAPIDRAVQEVYGNFEAIPSPSNIRMTRTWDSLDDVPRVGVWLIHLFAFFCRRPHTGILQLNHGNNTVEILLNQGMVEDVRVADQRMNEILGGLLLSSKAIRVTQLQEALDVVQDEGIRIDKAFFNMGIVKPADLVRALRQAYIRLVEECLEASAGTYRFQQRSQMKHQSGPIQMSVHQLVVSCLRGTLNDLEPQIMEDRFEPILERYPFIPASTMEIVNQLTLSQKERHVVENVLNGSITLSKGFTASALNATQLTRLVVLLSVTGCLEFMATQQRYAPGESPEEMLGRMVERLTEQHYFERLHIHWTEHGPAIESAYAELKGAYGPDSREDAPTLKASKLAEQVWFLITEAYQRLSTPDGRRRIRAEMFDENAIENAAEVLFTQGEMAAFRGDRVEARTVFERAIDLDPKPSYEEALVTHCGTFETVDTGETV